MLDVDHTYFNSEDHLGDIIDTLIFLENYGIIKNKIFTIQIENNAAGSIISCFDFKYLKIGDVKKNHRGRTQMLLWDYFKNSKEKIHLPSYLYPTKNFNNSTAIQLDSRSANFQKCRDGSIKVPFKKWEMKKALKKFTKDPKFLIGGMDTINYFPEVSLKKGDIYYVIKEIYECNFFVGVCSGLAHLAGLLQKPGVVITLFGHKNFPYFYKKVFPSLECLSRKQLIGKIY